MHQQQQLLPHRTVTRGGTGRDEWPFKKMQKLEKQQKGQPSALTVSLLPLTHTRLLRSSAYARYGLYFKASTLESTESPAVIAAFHNTRSS